MASTTTHNKQKEAQSKALTQMKHCIACEALLWLKHTVAEEAHHIFNSKEVMYLLVHILKKPMQSMQAKQMMLEVLLDAFADHVAMMNREWFDPSDLSLLHLAVNECPGVIPRLLREVQNPLVRDIYKKEAQSKAVSKVKQCIACEAPLWLKDTVSELAHYIFDSKEVILLLVKTLTRYYVHTSKGKQLMMEVLLDAFGNHAALDQQWVVNSDLSLLHLAVTKCPGLIPRLIKVQNPLMRDIYGQTAYMYAKSYQAKHPRACISGVWNLCVSTLEKDERERLLVLKFGFYRSTCILHILPKDVVQRILHAVTVRFHRRPLILPSPERRKWPS